MNIPSYVIVAGFSLFVLMLAGVLIIYSRRQYQKKLTINASKSAPSFSSSSSSSSQNQTDDVVVHASQNTEVENKAALMPIYLVANPNQPYQGYELLQALLAVYLRHGKMNIFHRYVNEDGTGPVLFSIASVAEPGEFDLSKIGGMQTPGLVLFLRPNQVSDPLVAFELMCRTAMQLQADLGGSVLDEQRQPLNDSSLSRLRAQLNV